VAGLAGEERRLLLGQALKAELEMRRGLGEAPGPEDYLTRFAGEADVIAAVFARAPTAPEAPAPARGPLPQPPGYVVLSLLGEGGMSDVYLARQERLNRTVALKLVRGGWGRVEAAGLARNEAEALGRLNDPHVVQVFDVGEHEGRPFLALEYVRGESLADRLRGGPLPPRAAARLVEVLACTLHTVHGAGLVHRDLKPHNVFLLGDPRGPVERMTPKVGDFGLVKYLDAGAGKTRTGLVLGTPSYMAPEQARGDNSKVGPCADVYALGAILYECLTGRPPFLAADTLGTLLQVVTDQPVSPRLLNRQVGAGLAFICLKCLEKDPERRYRSAAELAADLRLWLDDKFVVPGSWWGWLLRPLNRPFRDPDYPSLNARDLRIDAVLSLVAAAGLFLLLRGASGGALWAWLLLSWYLPSWAHWAHNIRGRALTPMAWDILRLWLAVDLAELILFSLFCPLWGPADAAEVLRVFPIWTVVRGLNYFTEGHLCWGRLYLVGAAHFLAAPLLPLTGAWAPLAYGALAAGVFFWVSVQPHAGTGGAT
jgi:serine/threonine-protein kinase